MTPAIPPSGVAVAVNWNCGSAGPVAAVTGGLPPEAVQAPPATVSASTANTAPAGKVAWRFTAVLPPGIAWFSMKRDSMNAAVHIRE
ncbi:hypothetical protein [Nocardia sp. BMG111209]|uniref:hypothetical protein n=1 Tax=Nocardia sp. BMG111209 TaxID=1160137 RepID=UPI0003780410|nr:hypothetical protein [Nocardia sp. BMG111209]